MQSFPCIKMVVAMKAANPNWKPGQKFDTSILDNVTRESVEATLVKNGNSSLSFMLIASFFGMYEL